MIRRGSARAIVRSSATPAPSGPAGPADRPAAAEPFGEPASAPPRSLYIHVPFCVSICPYCDFVVVAGAAARGPGTRVPAFLAALRRELELRADALDARWGRAGEEPSRPALDTVYFGGGTPSLLPENDLAGLLGLVRDRFGVTEGAEITAEANPGPDERGDAVQLAAAGITRISYGAQALDEASLRALGRRHHVADVVAAVEEARAAGITSLSLDLLYDLPDQTVAAFAATLEAALDLGPDHLSVYALTLDDPDAEGLTGPGGDHLPTRPGARRWRAAAGPRQGDDRAAAVDEHATARLAEAGFAGYEISNWARPGHESRHNLAYWTRRPHEAVGPGAHAFDGRVRRWNAARLNGYVEALAPGHATVGVLPPGGKEIVDRAGAAAEAVILGLRLADGVPAELGARPPLEAQLAWARAPGSWRKRTMAVWPSRRADGCSPTSSSRASSEAWLGMRPSPAGWLSRSSASAAMTPPSTADAADRRRRCPSIESLSLGVRRRRPLTLA
ncbi:MAG: coproporphyrinogen III oxidase family protein [Chloroflexi bacterium]|nr:coproporphyrinogen III oxidase family protein [Chloroflexota bacterium]